MKKIKLSSLVSLPYNPRTISDTELEYLKLSIKEHTVAIPQKERGKGFRLVTTVTVNKNGNRVVGGSQRIKALEALGQDWIHSDDITWVDLEPDSIREKALNIALNSEKAQGSWDATKLNEILGDIKLDDEALYETLGLLHIEPPKLDISKGLEHEQTTETKSAESLVVSSDVKTETTTGVVGSEPEPELEPEFEPEHQTSDMFKGDLKEDADQPPPDGTTPLPELFPLSYAVTKDQRNTVLEAIRKAKLDFELDTSAKALVKICELFLSVDDNEN